MNKSWSLNCFFHKSVNVESLLTYGEIGVFLSPRIQSGSRSTAVVGRLADYIKRNRPELRGYGKSNLYNMARVYDLFSDESFLSLTTKYQKQLPVPDNFFQMQNGKSNKGKEMISTCSKEIRGLNIF